jgi:hypothetical protein
MARAPDFDLVAALAQPSFTPAVRDAAALVALLARDGLDDATLARAQAALANLGEPGRIALERALDVGIAEDGAHAATIQALGLHARKADPIALARVIATLAAPTPRVRRAAISALG